MGERARLIRLSENTGGAGGFAVGIAAALADPEVDWIWVMDDDTVPGPEALAGALAAHERYRATGQDDLAVMGSRVVWTDGDDHPMNTPKAKIGATRAERDRAASVDAMAIRSISFVSAFLRAPRVRSSVCRSPTTSSGTTTSSTRHACSTALVASTCPDLW
ncbi:glycosyltransferase [Leucobacter soli]|uniref:glycosyltransferase n=1 Tax=Leucobacter soli TaxID=2812850 RepID=UPI003612A90B